jgi:uncharacterized protein YkwD
MQFQKNILCYVFFFLFTLYLQPVYASDEPLLTDAQSQEVIFNEINSYRVKQGLSPLKLSSVISEEAKTHSRDMAEEKVPFGHDGFYHRVHRLFAKFRPARGAAENVAYVYEDARGAVNLWLHSAGHRKNIMGNFNLTGIGIVHGEDDRVYVTQIFLRA